MNKIILMGRLTKDPEVRYSQGEKPVAIARYSLAVDRKFRREEGDLADFFQVAAFSYQADFAAKYLRKGMKILLSGRVQTGFYDNQGIKMPFFEVVAEEQEFAESKNAAQGSQCTKLGKEHEIYTDSNGFMQITDDTDELPFN